MTQFNYAFLVGGQTFGSYQGYSRIPEFVGKEAPELTIASWLNTAPLTLNGCKGFVVLIDFWATWCGPCRAILPHLQEIQEKYRGLKVIGVHSAGDGVETIPVLIERNKLTFPIGIDAGNEFEKGASFSMYGIRAVPQQVLIDKRGIIRANVSLENLLLE